MNRRSYLVGLGALALATTARAAENWGRYIGDLLVKLNDDGRTLTLLAPYQYDDAAARTWPVKKGWQVDGASIPRAFWSIIGGPLEGKYRNASVIHDYYCDVRTRAWQDVHHMFYAGMRASGVGVIKAKIMFAAVWYRGPRWPARVASASRLLRVVAHDDLPRVTEADVMSMRWLAQEIAKTDPTIAQIEALTLEADKRARALEEKQPALRETAKFETPRLRI